MNEGSMNDGGIDARSTLVVLHHRSFDGRVPAELMTDLGLKASSILRTGSIGFTATLTDNQMAAAARHPLVELLQPNPELLAPFIGIHPDPRTPDLYVAKLSDGDPSAVARTIGLNPSNATVTGVWLTATLTGDQLLALRADPSVDFVDFAIMDYPAAGPELNSPGGPATESRHL